MTKVVVAENRIPSMSQDDIAKVRRLESALAELPQIEIVTEHVLHGGMYARTICIPAGVALTGVFIRVPTVLVFDGHATVNAGEDPVTLEGYHVLAASAGRRQAFITLADTRLTMIFATQARTVEEAENEFTDEAHLLASRHADAMNVINITGE